MTTFIYALTDPFTQEIRYIGKANKPVHRLRQHLTLAERSRPEKRTYRDYWMMTLVRQGVQPIVQILEEVKVEDWPEREQFWIRHYREAGSPLTNLCDGGRGPVNPSEETRKKLRGKRGPEFAAKVSAAKKGRPNGLLGTKKAPEAVAKTAAAHRGSKRSVEARARISAAHKGFVMPAHHRELRSKALKGKPRPPEHGVAISAAKKGKPLTPAGEAQKWEMRRKAWQAAGYPDIPDMQCGHCGAKLYRAPCYLKCRKGGDFYCNNAHQMAARHAARREGD